MTTTVGNPFPFLQPPHRVVRMRWSEIVSSLSAGTGSLTGNMWRANDIYNITGSPGHQPYGYDQLAPYYGTWVVLGSKATIVCPTPRPAATTPAFTAGLHFTPNSSGTGAPTAATSIIEAGLGTWHQYAAIPGISSGTGFAAGTVNVENAAGGKKYVARYSLKKYFRDAALFDGSDLAGVTSAGGGSASPLLSLYYRFWTQAQDLTSTIPIYTLNGPMLIEYVVMWSDPVASVSFS